MTELRREILDHAVALAPFEGWNEHVLRQAAALAGLDYFAAKRLFPRGVFDLVEYFFLVADDALAETNPPEILAAARVPERIETLILSRLAWWQPHREAVRRALAYRALPWHTLSSLRSLHRTVDRMWRLAGDNALDFSWYTKRAILAAVYSSTVLYWLGDDSHHQENTHAFLKRRLDDVAVFGKLKKKWLPNGRLSNRQ